MGNAFQPCTGDIFAGCRVPLDDIRTSDIPWSKSHVLFNFPYGLQASQQLGNGTSLLSRPHS